MKNSPSFFDPLPITYEEAIQVPHGFPSKCKPFNFNYNEYGILQTFRDCLPTSMAMSMIYWEIKLGLLTDSRIPEVWATLSEKITKGRGSTLSLIYSYFHQASIVELSSSPSIPFERTELESIESENEFIFEADEEQRADTLTLEDRRENEVTQTHRNGEILQMKIDIVRMNTFVELIPAYMFDPQIPQILIYDNNALRNISLSGYLHASLLFEIDIKERHINLLDPVKPAPEVIRPIPQGHHLNDFFNAWKSAGMCCLQIYPRDWEDRIQRLSLELFDTSKFYQKKITDFFP